MSFDCRENDLIEKLRKQTPKLTDANIKFMGNMKEKEEIKLRLM